MKSLLTVIGIVVLLSGLFFTAQGSGLIPWPPESLMINQTKWVYYGLGIAIIGVVLIVLARR
jgi:multisubunit Na+/H+ antiporter MnhG subunit